ncbi:MAG: hypothetical protein WCL06_16245, partial [Bacteroidota bacterium]
MNDTEFKWFNQAQLYTMAIGAKDEYDVCSRGFGKTEGIDAPRLRRNVISMPRSTGALLSPTYSKLLTNTLPGVCAALHRMGLKRNIHYVVRRKPEKKLNFATPMVEPFEWDHTMSFWNGTLVNLISFDRPMSANSFSLDWIMGFEAKFLDYKKITEEVFQANRGNEHHFRNCPWHHGMVFTTDMPTFKSGMWILDKKNLMNTIADPDWDERLTYNDIIDTIRVVFREYKEYSEKDDKSPYYIKKIDELYKELNFYRKKAILYSEFDIFENLEIISEKRIADFKRDLPTFIFNTSILNISPRKVQNGFYSALNEKVHTYESYNNNFLESLDFDDKIVGKTKTCK